MKTLKFSICLILTQMAMMAASAQTMTTTDSLMKYKWVFQADLKGYVTELSKEFDRTSQLTTTIYDKTHEWYDPSRPVYELVNQYYVSDTKETSFRQSEVGKNKNGQYLIVKRKGDSFDVFEISFMEESGREPILRLENQADVAGDPVSYHKGVPKKDK